MPLLYFEKKFELHFQDSVDLLRLENLFWQTLVAGSGLHILKEAETAKLRAFLLAESSLLVWKNRLLLLTCGAGRLTDVLRLLKERLGIEAMTAFRYASPEPVSDEEKKQFESIFSGGHWERPALHAKLAWLQYFWAKDPGVDAALFLSKSYVDSDFPAQGFPKDALKPLRESEVFQEHDFPNQGYSCNACRGEEYLTVHYSPNPGATYLSVDWRGYSEKIEGILENLRLKLR